MIQLKSASVNYRGIDNMVKLGKLTDITQEGDTFQKYLDTGCEASPTCLTCPLPECKHDNPTAARQVRMAAKDTKVIAALEFRHTAGASWRVAVDEVAELFSITVRSVWRIKARAS